MFVSALKEKERKEEDRVPVRVYNAKKPGAVVWSSDVVLLRTRERDTICFADIGLMRSTSTSNQAVRKATPETDMLLNQITVFDKMRRLFQKPLYCILLHAAQSLTTCCVLDAKTWVKEVLVPAALFNAVQHRRQGTV